jgi:dTDP-4-amino-4,6-dideoxygalactose transaminase
MRSPMPHRLPFALPDVGDEEIAAAVEAIRSGWVTSGPQMVAFEKDFTDAMQGEVLSVAVSSATAGLHLCLEACGIGPGDEVIVPTWTFTATAEVVRYLGAIPVLVDVDERTLNLDLEAVAKAITPRTRAVIPVHMAGLAVDVRALRSVVGPNVRIIEDAAHALPTVTDGILVGTCADSDAAVFSFYATKTITTGEGGMVTTRHPELAARIRVMRLHGIDRDAFDRYRSERPAWAYDVIAPGYKYNMPDPAAAIGRVQLRRSKDMHARRSEIAERYLEAFAELPLDLPSRAPENGTHAWHLFIVRVRDEAGVTRDGFVDALATEGIGTSVHFIPLHLLTYWRDSLQLKPSDFPVASRVFPSVVSLPLFSAMDDAAVTKVVDGVRRVLGR